MLEHEAEKIKINLLKYIINNQDINIILKNFSEIIEDLIDEYNINNNCILDNESNKIIINNKYQKIKEYIMQEYLIINKDIYSKYFLNNKKDNLDKLTPLSNFIKHCTKCNEIAIHKSRNPLYLIPNTNYVICKETNEIYDKNNFECFCDYDDEIFISSFIESNYKNNIFALMHQNSLDDEKILCKKCKHILYYNSRNKKIKYFKCNTEELNEYNNIFYNEIFFNKLKEEINFSLIMKRKSNPNKYCQCGGICYQGKFLEKYILVCSKCQKCQYDIRNGRYKYKLYLFQKKKKNQVIIKPKVIINFENFNKTKINRNNYYNINTEGKHEEKKNDKEYYLPKRDLKEMIKIKREFVIKKAKLLLLNKSMIENNNQNINNLLLETSNNKTLVASRKIRALNGYNLNSNENKSNKINKFRINKLLINSLDEAYNKALDDKKEKNNFNNRKIIKKTLTNNNSFNNINISINRNTFLNLNNFSFKKNYLTNKNTNIKRITNIKRNLPSDLNISEYKIISIINSSPFSTIYKVQNISSKKNYVIKKIIFSSKLNLEIFQKQYLELLQILNYAFFLEGINIIPIIQYYVKKLDNISYAFYELIPLADTDLNKKINNTKKILSQETLIKILKQLTNAFCYMQKIGIAHRDIKPGNIFMINDNYYIGDFEQSIKVKLNNTEEEIKGTEAFLSPLLFNALIRNNKKVKHNIFKSDVYSFGLCFIYALTKNLYVLQKIKEVKQGDKIKQFILDNLIEKKIELNHNFFEIIIKMVTWDEKNRPDFIELNELIKEKNF